MATDGSERAREGGWKPGGGGDEGGNSVCLLADGPDKGIDLFLETGAYNEKDYGPKRRRNCGRFKGTTNRTERNRIRKEEEQFQAVRNCSSSRTTEGSPTFLSYPLFLLLLFQAGRNTEGGINKSNPNMDRWKSNSKEGNDFSFLLFFFNESAINRMKLPRFNCPPASLIAFLNGREGEERELMG